MECYFYDARYTAQEQGRRKKLSNSEKLKLLRKLMQGDSED
jgi:hypothetical protein